MKLILLGNRKTHVLFLLLVILGGCSHEVTKEQLIGTWCRIDTSTVNQALVYIDTLVFMENDLYSWVKYYHRLSPDSMWVHNENGMYSVFEKTLLESEKIHMDPYSPRCPPTVSCVYYLWPRLEDGDLYLKISDSETRYQRCE